MNKRVCADSNILSKLVSMYQAECNHQKLNDAVLIPLYTGIKKGEITLYVTTLCQEEMIDHYSKFRASIEYLSAVNAELTPCASDHLMSTLQSYIEPSKVFTDNYAGLSKHEREEKQRYQNKYFENVEKSRKIMVPFYEKQAKIREAKKAEADYSFKKNLVTVLGTYYASKKIMEAKDVFDIYNLTECCIYNIDEYVTANYKDYQGVSKKVLDKQNADFVEWFNKNKNKNMLNSYLKLTEKFMNYNKVCNNKKSHAKFLASLYSELGIHERADGNNNKAVINMRINRLANILDVTPSNFKTKFADLTDKIKNNELEDRITSPDIKIIR